MIVGGYKDGFRFPDEHTVSSMQNRYDLKAVEEIDPIFPFPYEAFSFAGDNRKQNIHLIYLKFPAHGAIDQILDILTCTGPRCSNWCITPLRAAP